MTNMQHTRTWRLAVLVLLPLLITVGLGLSVQALSANSTPHTAVASPPAADPVTTTAITPTGALALTKIGAYETNIFDESAAEIVAHNPADQLLYVVNGDSKGIDVLDMSDPTNLALSFTIPVTPYGAGANSVDFYDGVLVAAVEAVTVTNPGKAVFFDAQGTYLNDVTTGALPDMVTFSHDGQMVLTADEGEPDDGVDPEGSVTMVDLSGGVASATAVTVGFTHFTTATIDPAVRIFPGKTVAEDVEPEYITLSADDSTAWITLQEANAVAVLDTQAMTITAILPLGTIDHSVSGSGLDASDRDSGVNIANWPVSGLFMPDAIASYDMDGTTYLVTANEGDDRGEDERIKDLTLDPTTFPNAATLQQDENMGRLGVSTIDGDTDGDGDYDALYSYGARSFTIWNGQTGARVFDSGEMFEQITAVLYPDNFNASNDNNDLDNRSDNKGPEPEGVAIGELNGRVYAFIGLERIGGIMVFDVTDPNNPEYTQYINTRDFGEEPGAGAGGDLGPEGLTFIPAADSPTGNPLLVVAYEVSGSTAVYEISQAVTLTLLHNNDGESSLLTTTNTVMTDTGYGNSSDLDLIVGGVDAFKSVVEAQVTDANNKGNAVVNVYAGDAFLASAALQCTLPPENGPFYDAIAQTKLPYTAHALGNHEFDYGPEFLAQFIGEFGGTQPFLSANLDFSGEPSLAALADADGLIEGAPEDDKPLARSLVYTDTNTGAVFGIVGATTPELPIISSPGNVTVTADITATATAVQGEIDRLDTLGVNKIIFVSHMQDLDVDEALIGLLSGVDIAVGGGGDQLLVNNEISATVPITAQLLPGETEPIYGQYPLEIQDADSETVYLVTAKGQYKYVGRLDVVFDAMGEITEVVTEDSYTRRVIPDTNEASTLAALNVTDAVTPDADMTTTVMDEVEACLAGFDNTAVAFSEVVLEVSRSNVRGGESNMGNLIADGFAYTYNTLSSPTNPVVAVQNGGGIRQTAGDELSGLISRRNTLDVLPFNNTLVVIEDMDAATLKAVMERAIADPLPDGGFLQVSGFMVMYDTSQAVDSRVVGISLADGTPLVQNGQVVSGAPVVDLVTNNFTAGGGDGYEVLANLPQVTVTDGDGQPVSYERALLEYLQGDDTSFPLNGDDIPTIQASDDRYQPGGEGRITFVKSLYLPLVFGPQP
jgi:2',3'-cyclic-nucleotide 2'-phosphodiesterase/3'-nucleotidase/5'-nucleotidase